MSSREILKTKLIEILKRDYKSAKLRMEAFGEGTEEYALNKATMRQASHTLFDIRMIDIERLENFK